MRRNNFLLGGIILIGLVLRLFILSQRGSLWFDEAFSVHFASMEIPRLLAYLRFENNPPLYFILLHYWMAWMGNSEFVVRLLSMSFGLAAFPLVYLIGKRLHSSTAGLFATFLTAISTFQVFYSTETRMYSLYLFLALLTVLIYLKLEERRKKNVSASGLRGLFFITLSALVWTHITAWMMVLALAVYMFWKSRWSPKEFVTQHARFMLIVALLIVQFLPWIVNFVQLKIAAPLAQGYFFYIPPDKNYFFDIIQTMLVFGQDNAFVVTLLSVVIVGCLFFALRPITRSGRFLLCWLFVPLFIGFAFSNAIPRYFIAASPALYLLLGIGFAKMRFQAKWAVPLLAFALIFPDYPSLQKIGHHEWDKLARWIENEECRMKNVECKELVLVNPHSEILPFERYYRGQLPVVGFYPRDDEDDRDMRIVKTNWLSINTKENVLWLQDVTKGLDTVFLVTGEIDQTIGRNLVPLWFWENGWQKRETREFGRISVMRLDRFSIEDVGVQ